MQDIIEAILPIIVIFVAVLIGVFCLFFLYQKLIRLTNEKARKIEIFGYVLLFVVLVWELIVKNMLSESFYNDDWFFLNEKLKAIYILLEDILINDKSNLGVFMEDFYNDTSEVVRIQLLAIDIIEAVLKIASTVLIAVGRFHELEQWGKEKTDSVEVKKGEK